MQNKRSFPLLLCLFLAMSSFAQKAKNDHQKQISPPVYYDVFNGEFQWEDFDLKKSVSTAHQNQLVGAPYSYTSIMLSEFLNKYYPDKEFSWKQLKVGYFFGFSGKTKLPKQEEQEVVLSWQSYSDGLEWCFFNTDLTRSTQKDPWMIVEDKAIRTKIQEHLKQRFSESDLKNCDVFIKQYRSFCTIQKTENVPYPSKDFEDKSYGVYIKKEYMGFDLSGNLLKE